MPIQSRFRHFGNVISVTVSCFKKRYRNDAFVTAMTMASFHSLTNIYNSRSCAIKVVAKLIDSHENKQNSD